MRPVMLLPERLSTKKPIQFATFSAALRPFVVNGKFKARQTLKLSIAFDHRVHDGAPAAKFLDTLVTLLEQPARLLI